MKKFESYVLLFFMVVFTLLVGIFSLFVIYNNVTSLLELPEYQRQLENHCNKVQDEFSINWIEAKCEGYDNEGYKYYWKKDKDSSKWYKVRIDR